MKILEKICLWYLKKYWNSKAYKAEQAHSEIRNRQNRPHGEPHTSGAK